MSPTTATRTLSGVLVTYGFGRLDARVPFEPPATLGLEIELNGWSDSGFVFLGQTLRQLDGAQCAELVGLFDQTGLPDHRPSFEYLCHSGLFGEIGRFSGQVDRRPFAVTWGGWAIRAIAGPAVPGWLGFFGRLFALAGSRLPDSGLFRPKR